MERRIKREDTRRTSTLLFVTLNKKTHTVSALWCFHGDTTLRRRRLCRNEWQLVITSILVSLR